MLGGCALRSHQLLDEGVETGIGSRLVEAHTVETRSQVVRPISTGTEQNFALFVFERTIACNRLCNNRSVTASG